MTDRDSSTLPMLVLGGRKTWELPELTALNTVLPHTQAIPFPAGEAIAGDPAQSPWLLSLNGTWQFKLLPRPEAATAEAAAADNGWTAIQVPGNWTMQGFGAPHYTNIVMPFPEQPPHVPAENPTGLYRTAFSVPASWRGRRIVLHIGGCEGACYVYIDGRAVGLHKDARTPAEYEMTALLHPGETHTLVAVVPRWSDASFVEDQDQWWQSGIHRDVFLYATDTVYLADLWARGDLKDDLRGGILRLRCRLGATGEVGRCQVAAQLYDAAGAPLFAQPLSATYDPREQSAGSWHLGKGPTLELERHVEAPRLWSAELPYLYTLVVTVHGPGGAEGASCPVGFRR
ncbi:MAG TPA: beta-galactosidase, partial [Chloroflexota bacterium]|nr:beta-galactosidase [Chloroflexota bacterium]